MSALPNVLVALVALLVIGLALWQIRAGRARALGRGVGPVQHYDRHGQPGRFWFTVVAELAFGLWALSLALSGPIPWR